MTKEKKFMMFGVILLLISLVGSLGTYAWFTWKSTNNTSLTMSIGKLADVIFTSGNSISTSTLAPVYNYTDGEKTTFSINNKDTSGTTIDYAVKLNITSIDSELKSTSLKYVLLKNDTIVQEGDFSTITTGSTVIYSDSISSNGVTNFIFYLYIDGNSENNLNMMNKSLVGTITVGQLENIYQLTNGDGSTYTPAYSGSGTKAVRSDAPLNKFKEVKVDEVIVDNSNYTLTEGSTIVTFKESYLQSLSAGEHTFKIMSTDGFTSGKITIKKLTAAQMITNLYNSSTKTAVTNNSITYQYDTTHSLMKDVDSNVRYYGASPDNYIYFNCSDYSNQSSSTCETWRVIGVFGDKVKLIRNEKIGQMEYDDDNEDIYLQSIVNNSNKVPLAILLNYNENILAQFIAGSIGDGQNDYSKSSLQKILNNYYYNCLTYNGKSTYNFTAIGIKNDITRNLIADTTYYLGGWDDSSVYSNQIYDYERGMKVYSGNAMTWTGKIALAYPSDYGYAVDLSKCSQTLHNYSNSACTSNNWMKSVIISDGTQAGWLLTTYHISSTDAWYIYPLGHVGAGSINGSVFVTPVLYLNSELTIKLGTGSSSNPYQLDV